MLANLNNLNDTEKKAVSAMKNLLPEAKLHMSPKLKITTDVQAYHVMLDSTCVLSFWMSDLGNDPGSLKMLCINS